MSQEFKKPKIEITSSASEYSDHHSPLSSEPEPFPNESDSDPEYLPGIDERKRKSTKTYLDISGNKPIKRMSNLSGECFPEAESSSVTSEISNNDDDLKDSYDAELKKLQKNALYDGTFFSIVNISGKHILVKCSLCVKETMLKGLNGVNSNFLKHLRNIHERSFEKYQLYKKEKTYSTQEYRSSSVTQLTIAESLRQEIIYPTQVEFDDKLIKFVTATMLPLSIIEHKTFKDLFTNSGITVMSRGSLVKKIDKQYDKSMKYIRHEVASAKYVCTTADIWSANHRSFLGITCHWLDIELNRYSVTLACRRFEGAHSYDKISEILEDVFLNFNLDNRKIVSTVTDNGCNFVKTFKEYGLKIEDEELDSEHGEGLNFVSLSAEDLPLPKHYRCISQTLTLLATTDLNNVINSNVNLRPRHEKLFQKCSALWNKAGKPKSAEIVKDVLGHALSYPIITRWNSFYQSLLQIIEEKEKLKDLCQRLEVKDEFKYSDVQYLEEYCTLLKPVAATLEFLQTEKNMYYGYLLPSIISLKVKLQKLNAEVSLRILKITLDKVIEKFDTRFSIFFNINQDSTDAIIAATTIPSIKLRWLNVFKETNPSVDKKTIIQLILTNTRDMFTDDILTIHNSSDPVMNQPTSTDFFDFKEELPLPENKDDAVLKSEAGNDVFDLVNNKVELELLQYIEDKRDNLEMLKEYPLVRDIFIKYNTSLPSSAPVERLFSFTTYINSPRRNALSDELFEKLVFLKGNVLQSENYQ